MAIIFNCQNMKTVRRSLRNRPTRAEQRLWYMLKNDQQGVRFRRQHSIGRYVVDFYAPHIHLVIEVDGNTHFEEGAQEKDKERQYAIEKLGLSVLRFTDQEVLEGMEITLENLRGVIARLISDNNSP